MHVTQNRLSQNTNENYVKVIHTVVVG